MLSQERRPPDSGLGSSREEETNSSHNSTPIINNDVISINDDVNSGGDSDVIVLDSDDEMTGIEPPGDIETSAALQSTSKTVKPNTEKKKNQSGLVA